MNGCHRPREFSAFDWIARSFEAATIFIAFVIFWIFLTLFIRLRTVDRCYQHRTWVFPNYKSTVERKKVRNFRQLTDEIIDGSRVILPIWVDTERTPKKDWSLLAWAYLVKSKDVKSDYEYHMQLSKANKEKNLIVQENNIITRTYQVYRLLCHLE